MAGVNTAFFTLNVHTRRPQARTWQGWLRCRRPRYPPALLGCLLAPRGAGERAGSSSASLHPGTGACLPRGAGSHHEAKDVGVAPESPGSSKSSLGEFPAREDILDRPGPNTRVYLVAQKPSVGRAAGLIRAPEPDSVGGK